MSGKRRKSPRESESERVPQLLKQAFDTFAQASKQLEQSYAKLKVRADRLAKELAQTNEELQRQLAEKERISNFLNNILDSVASGIVVVGPDGRVALTNRSAERLLGFDEGGAEGSHYAELLGGGPVGSFLCGCLESGANAPRSGEVELHSPGGRSNYVLNFAPVLDSGGLRVGSLLVVQDVTRLKRLEEQAVRTGRLAAMGEVATELAHEIRNPLGSIEIFASLLSRDLAEGENRKLAENIVVGVKSLNAVVSNMLTFTRSVEVHPESLDINALVRETLGFLEPVLAAQEIELRQDLDEGLPALELDPELFKQVLLNLAQNSVNAMEGGGTLSVSTKGVQTEEGRRVLVMRVSDSGCGIDAQHLPRIFDPFFSTRRGGTGLGLSVVNQILEKHGGMISADSEPGRGTRMTIQLPLETAGTGQRPSGTK